MLKKSATQASAQPAARGIGLEPVWNSETYDGLRRGLLTTYLKLFSASAAIFPNELLRQEVIRLNRAIKTQIEVEEKESDEAFDITEEVDDLVSRACQVGHGKLPTEITNLLEEAPGLTSRHHVN